MIFIIFHSRLPCLWSATSASPRRTPIARSAVPYSQNIAVGHQQAPEGAHITKYNKTRPASFYYYTPYAYRNKLWCPFVSFHVVVLSLSNRPYLLCDIFDKARVEAPCVQISIRVEAKVRVRFRVRWQTHVA